MALCRDAFRWVLGVLVGVSCLAGAATAGEAQPAKTEDPKGDAIKQAKSLVKKDDQPKPAEKTYEVTVTAVATKSEKDPYEVPASVESFDRKRMDRLGYANFVDTFKETPGVSVQKTGQGQGSPMIRGVTGYRNVLMIDGVRFNNSTFRSGPNQYWATLDPLFVDRVDLLRGPGSTLYGSDAIGGVVNVLTKSTTTWGDGLEWGGEVYSRVATAEQARIGHVEFMGSYKDKLGWIVGGSYKDYDDFVAGSETDIVDESAYQEGAFNAKIQYRPIKDHELTLYYDFFDEGDSPRTEQTRYATPFHGTGVGTELRRDLDQERQLGYARYAMKNLDTFVEEVSFTFSWQKVKEQQHRKRRVTGPVRIEKENAGFQDDILGANVQAISETPIGRMTYGIDFQHEDIQSKAVTLDVTRNRVSKANQGPIGDNAHYTTTGVYIQDEKDLFDGMVTLTAGGRFEYIDLDIGRVQDPAPGRSAFTLGVDEDYKSLVGSFKALVRPDKDHGNHWHAWAGIQQSFRAPSVSDLSPGSTSNSFAFVLPGARNSEPEHYLTPEVGVKARYEKVSWEATYFYTMIESNLSSAPTGQFAPDGRPIFTSTLGSGKGWIKGIETAVSYNFYKDFTFWGNLTWTEGEQDQFDADRRKYRKPGGDRIIPVMSHLGVIYEPAGQHWWVEVHGDIYSDADRLSLGNRSDTRRIPPGGTPGFKVFGFRGGVKLLDDKLDLIGAVDNVTDEDYRIHGSGQNMPGRNFSLSLRFKW
ncbi:MAG: TonB-dependent receptor [Planctomycetota bacterium]|nr:TonB-dependent receptor [Planctomycetota bacterium]